MLSNLIDKIMRWDRPYTVVHSVPDLVQSKIRECASSLSYQEILADQPANPDSKKASSYLSPLIKAHNLIWLDKMFCFCLRKKFQISKPYCYTLVEFATAASQNGLSIINFPFIRKPILFRKWQKRYIFITSIFNHRAVVKQDHYMTTTVELGKHILWCSHCKIHSSFCSSTTKTSETAEEVRFIIV
jgi:hypothetical protein